MENKDIYTYKALVMIEDFVENTVIYRPVAKIVFPSEDDYRKGKYMRYFFKRKNEYPVLETTRDEFEKISEEMYSKVEMLWTISGNIQFAKKSNELEISSAIQKMGDSLKKIHPLQFFKP